MLLCYVPRMRCPPVGAQRSVSALLRLTSAGSIRDHSQRQPADSECGSVIQPGLAASQLCPSDPGARCRALADFDTPSRSVWSLWRMVLSVRWAVLSEQDRAVLSWAAMAVRAVLG